MYRTSRSVGAAIHAYKKFTFKRNSPGATRRGILFAAPREVQPRTGRGWLCLKAFDASRDARRSGLRSGYREDTLMRDF